MRCVPHSGRAALRQPPSVATVFLPWALEERNVMQRESERAFAAVDVPLELAYDKTGPNTPAGRYLRQFWIPVAEIADVKPARAKTITIMSEQFTLYRGESG